MKGYTHSSVTGHPDRSKIDAALAAGDSMRKVARDFGVGKGALTRYARRQTVPQRASQELRAGVPLGDLMAALNISSERVSAEIIFRLQVGEMTLDEVKGLLGVTEDEAPSGR